MTKKVNMQCALIAVMALCLYGGFADADTAKKAAPAVSQKIEKKAASKEITATTMISKDHPEIPEGISCVDCHEIKFDAQTTATEVWMKGKYIKYNEGEGMMNADQVRQEIVKILGGKKQKRTCVLATCINNTPLSTTADFVLDPDTMTIYGLHEKGTTKLFHIMQNPRVSLNWHREFETWGNVLCVQCIGTAELVDGANPEMEKVLQGVYPYEDMAQAMKLEPQVAREMVKKGMLMTKITLHQVTVNNSDFEKEGKRKYQRWERK
jgi:nitroimidazol reductase NimA-like FMN-containing flavoprotein (pyridoxamine 5'-phosphate oxidase superfamily)